MSASIYKASAGAGKTYLLVQHYIAFCLQPRHRFDQALAITFTNKAAGEMKGRILDMLHLLATDKATTVYVEQLQQIMSDKRGYSKLTPQQIQFQAKKTRSEILHRYGQFAVGTIDAFFQRILRSFARELELSVNYNLELDQETILKEVVDLLMDRLSVDTGLADWLLQFMREKMAEGKSWNLEKDLLSFSKQLLEPAFQTFSTQHEDLRSTVLRLKSDLLKLTSIFENKMDSIGKEGLAVIERHGLTYDNFLGGKSGIGNHFNKIQSQQQSYAPTATVLQVIKGEKGHCSKATKDTRDIDAAWYDGVEALLIDSITYYDQQGKAYETAKMTLKYLNQLGILNDMAQLLKQIRDDRDLLLISDTNHLLASLTNETDTPFVYEKVGQQFRFFLLDEFQDTSTQQWLNLLPLLQHALDANHEVLIVGDVKQSIYRWRGGNMELLREQVHQQFQHFPGFSSTTIESNWRSLPAIVGFNNAFFSTLPNYLKDEIRSSDTENLLGQLFADVQQKSMRSDDTKPGYVQIELIPFNKDEEEEDSWKLKHVLQLIPEINKVLADGYTGKDICFLVDTNRDGALLAQFLSEKGYDVISQDSLLLGNAKAIQLIIQTLKWLVNPDEMLLQVQLAYTYLESKGEKDTALQLLSTVGTTVDPMSQLVDFPTTILHGKESLLRLPLYDLIEHIVQEFGLDQDADAFVTQFLDKVLDFTQEDTAILPAFIDWWEERGHKEALTTTATTHAMQIMTIHKSKGLQFPIVFIPFLHFNYAPKFNPLLWLPAPDEKPYPAQLLLPIRYSSKGEHTYFNKYFIQELLLIVSDTLNKWYVAFTRAADRLYVMANNPEKNKPDSAKLFQQILSSEAPLSSTTFGAHWQPETSRFTFGEPLQAQQENKIEHAQEVPTEGRKPWQERIALRASNKTIEAYSDQTNNTQLHFGRLFHELFARIDALEDIPFQLQQLVLEGWCKTKEAKVLLDDINKILVTSELKSWFDPSWQPIREHDLLLPDGQTKRPDRVIVQDDKAKVLDYKTGLPKEEDVVQVKEYAALLTQMGYSVSTASLFYTTTATFQNVPLS